jgi:hypothetical protein
VEKVLLKALAKNADDRYQDMEEFAAALKDVIASGGKGRAGSRKMMASPRPQAAPASLDTVMMEQEEDEQATRLQDTIREERTSGHGLPGTQDLLPPDPSIHRQKKGTWWPWAAGLGGLVLLTLIILIVFSSRNQIAAPAPTATHTPTQTATRTPARTLTPAPTWTPTRTWTRTPTPIPLQGLEGSWSDNSYIFTIEWQENGYVVTWCNIWNPVPIGNQTWDASEPKLSWTCYYNGSDGVYYYYFETVSVNGDQLTVYMVVSRDQTRLAGEQRIFYRNP